jgi:hypothetical protein
VLAYLRSCYLITLDGCDYIKQFMPEYTGIQVAHGDNLVHMDETGDDIGPDYTIKSAINSLKKELEWEAKEMAFSLITKPGSDFGIWLAISRKIDMKRVGKAGVEPAELGKDKQFMKLLCEVQKDFDRGFKAANAVARQGK